MRGQQSIQRADDTSHQKYQTAGRSQEQSTLPKISYPKTDKCALRSVSPMRRDTGHGSQRAKACSEINRTKLLQVPSYGRFVYNR